MLVEEFLERSAEQFPEKIALVCGNRRLCYREIDHRSNQLANCLIAKGVQRGDRVAVYLDNSVATIIALFGILKSGAAFVVVNPSTKTDKLLYILNNCRAAVVVTSGFGMTRLNDSWGKAPYLRLVIVTDAQPKVYATWDIADACLVTFETVFLDYPAERPTKRCIDIDLAALIYTSGSTGKPKGVMMTHLNIVSAATSITTYLENTSKDVIINVLPLAFDYGLYQLLMAFRMGATLVLERSFLYPTATLETMVREKVTGLPLVPTISAILLQMDLRNYDFSSLRYITNTGAALPREHIRKLRQVFPTAKIFSMYGLTECKRVSYLPPEEIDLRPTSVGKAIPNEEVYIVDENGRRVGPKVVGELVIRGSNVMRGYWESPEATDQVLKPGPLPGEKVLYSGDLFRMDEDGYLYFVARKDDIIKTRGEKVSPREVEDVLCAVPGVAQAAVIGVADPILGSAIKAIVQPRSGVTLSEQEVLRYCAQHLEDFMVPKFIEFRSDLPKTESGKVSKRELAEGVSERYELRRNIFR